MKKATIAILFSFLGLSLVWELVVYFMKSPDATFSPIVFDVAVAFPPFAYIYGLLGGHFFSRFKVKVPIEDIDRAVLLVMIGLSTWPLVFFRPQINNPIFPFIIGVLSGVILWSQRRRIDE